MRVDRPIGGGTSDITRDDSTLWRVSLPGGNGTIRYRVRVQPPPPRLRDSWMPHARADGALINGPDFFLYVPELAHAPVMLGALHRWTFAEGSTQYTVAYWSQQQSVPFDTVAFVDGLERVARHAHAIFGRTPSTRYTMLIQDGATDALEHAASITAGVESDRLARSPHAWLSEIAHEYFHAWNLVAIRPTGFNDLSYRAPARTPLLWLSKGITRYYADALRRRAGLADSAQTRLERLRRLVERYLDSPGMRRVTRACATPRTIAADLTMSCDGCSIRRRPTERVVSRRRRSSGAPPPLVRVRCRSFSTRKCAGPDRSMPRRYCVGLDCSCRRTRPMPSTVTDARCPTREFVDINGVQYQDFGALLRTVRALHVGDTASVHIRRNGLDARVLVPLVGFRRLRVRFVDVPNVSPTQLARRGTWLSGR